MPVTVLVTGFGPFPGAPYNPTVALVTQLARRRWPGLRVVPHVFETSYAAVDRDLPALIARHRPDILLMFGLAARSRALRIETLARNALASSRDAGGFVPASHLIADNDAAMRPLPARAQRLLGAARRACVPVALSRNAGGYLCNYLCWRAAEAAAKAGGPRIASFIHVPAVARRGNPVKSHAKVARKWCRPADARGLERAGAAILAELARCR